MKRRTVFTSISLVLLAFSGTIFAAGHGGGVSVGQVGVGAGHAPVGGGRSVVAGGLHPVTTGNPAYYYSRAMPARNIAPRYPAGQLRPPLPRPHVFNGPDRSASNAIVNSRPITRNPAAALAAQQSARVAANQRTDHIFSRHDGNWHAEWDRRHAHFSHGHFFVFDNGFWIGLDQGIFPWDYYPYEAYDYYPYDYYPAYYAGTDPYYYGEGGYSATPLPDPTVSAVQTQLTQLGYYNGPIDGIFGAATRDAVADYQIAQQLEVTGSLSAQTLQSLAVPQPPPS